MDDGELRVFCLCAAWCGVCRDYRAGFEAAAAGTPAARFDWVDIEDEAALLDELDVENFPTLLLARGGRVLFFGTVTPQPGTLARLVQRAAAGELAPLTDAPEVAALAARLEAARV